MADKPTAEEPTRPDPETESSQSAETQQETAPDETAEEVKDKDPASGEEAGDDLNSDLNAQLAEAESKAEEFRDQYLRTAAEMENLRKRAARDVEQAHKFALEKFVVELLPVVDALEMGLNAAQDVKDQAGALMEGTEMTLKQFQQVMEKFGIEPISPEGEEFNPEYHEAMAMQPSSEQSPNTVLTVVQKGYLLNGRVVRPARVLVAKEPD